MSEKTLILLAAAFYTSKLLRKREAVPKNWVLVAVALTNIWFAAETFPVAGMANLILLMSALPEPPRINHQEKE